MPNRYTQKSNATQKLVGKPPRNIQLNWKSRLYVYVILCLHVQLCDVILENYNDEDVKSKNTVFRYHMLIVYNFMLLH